MNLPKINGQVDIEEVSGIIVTHILVETCLTIDTNKKKELEDYVTKMIEAVQENKKY